MKWLKLTLLGAVLFSVVAYAGLWWLFATASVTTHGDIDLGPGNVSVPDQRTLAMQQESATTRDLINSWAARDFLSWQDEGKVQMPRILLAKLAAGKDVAEVNRYLREAHVWGNVGSTGPLHPQGDYDFTLAGLSLLLFTYGNSPELLYPETVNHIVNVLMTQDGGTPVEFTPRLLGLPLRDTENHILMTEGSRYLKNRWLQLHGDDDPRYDNTTNGLEEFLLEHLGDMERAGFHEYNSRPYIGYTLTALLNLQSFAGPSVSAAATRILDRANWEYALGSLQYRRFPPFRRQPRRAADTDLDGDYHTAMVTTWMSLLPGNTAPARIRSGDHQALWVPFTTYRIPDTTARWIESKPREYFVRIGHGHDGSPELYSGGPEYLITAGGVARDRFEQAVARPTTLMLNDGSLELDQLISITGTGEEFRQWNNTGVYKRFAVGKRLRIPVHWQPIRESGDWSEYYQAGVSIVAYSNEKVGLFYVVPEHTAPAERGMLDAIIQRNPTDALQRQFVTVDDTTITYDVDANVESWVIQSVTGSVGEVIEFNRNHSSWPLLQDESGMKL